MKILALEFSTSRRSVAVAEGAAPEFRLLAQSVEQDPRAGTGMALVDRAVAAAGLIPKAIDVVAVGLGPGSYAGIRSAIAICQGWQLGRDVRLLGISSVDVLAAEAQLAGIVGEVEILIDAQRGEFYRATFSISRDAITLLGSLRTSPTAEISGGRTVVGPDISQIVGGGKDLYPNAAVLARLAAGRGDFLAGEQLEPIYLRQVAFTKAPPPRFAKP